MIRLTLLLCAALFLTLLIGGRDYGQVRPGLAGAYDDQPAPTLAAARPAKPQPGPDAEAQVVPASLTPVRPAAGSPLVLPLVTPAPALAPASAPAPEPAAEVWYVDARAVNVREGPTTDSAVVGRLSRGEAATVIGREGDDWVHILIEGDGLEGYVAARFLTPEPAVD